MPVRHPIKERIAMSHDYASQNHDAYEQDPTSGARPPGKRTLTASLQRRAGGPEERAKNEGARHDEPATRYSSTPFADDPFGLHLLGEEAVQRRGGDGDADPARIHDAAARGVAGPSTALPFADRIHASFGVAADVSQIRAHVGGAAAGACVDMNASAYARGPHVAFAGAPDLHTAAHEAAHVVQQSAGVNLEGGIGKTGDEHERHADAVADRVVAGESAVDLLGSFRGGRGTSAVQRKAGGGIRLDSRAVSARDTRSSRDRLDQLLSYVESDWAGRALLRRYLTGDGSDWVIANDSQWRDYMKSSKNWMLATQVRPWLQQLVRGVRKTRGKRFNRTYHAEMENGEGITGYNYLHGSNRKVGGFRIHGGVSGSGHPKSWNRFGLNVGFQWNDRIDRNNKYVTDIVKDAIAHLFFHPKPFTIRINWHSGLVARSDRRGGVTLTGDWPFS